MRKDKQDRHDKFVELIQEITAEPTDHPEAALSFEDFRWAALSQQDWASLLNISDRTLRDLAKIPPIVATKTTVADRVMVLYRIGSQPHLSVRHVANILAKMFRDKYGLKRITPYAFGCLCGLAEIWPQGVQAEIFKLVLKDFPAFRAGVKLADPDSEFIERYYEYVPIQLVRKYPQVALELYEMELQKSGKVPPQEIIDSNPAKWVSPITGKPLASGGSHLQVALKQKKLPDASSPPYSVL